MESYTEMKTLDEEIQEANNNVESQTPVDLPTTLLIEEQNQQQAMIDDDIHFDRKEAEHYKVYRTRWYILFIFAVCGIWQNLVYGTFAPIAQSAQGALDLTQTDLALLPNWYNIAYVISAFPFVYLVEVKGLRMPMTATMGFCALGASIRYLHTGDKAFDKVFLHLGQLANGFGAAVPWFACTTISAVWFPPGQRNLATAIGLFASNLGVAIAFLIGPGFIDLYKGDGTPEEIYQAIYKLFYFEGIISCVMLFMTVFYFPSRPPTPPSFTASTGRVSYMKGFLDFARNRKAWLMFAVYSLNTINQTWNQFVSLIVKDVMNETEVGWLGFTMTTVPIFLAPLLAALLALPFLEKWAKSISIVLIFGACGGIGVFTVGLVWGTVIPGVTLATISQPVWWEMACDASYPVPESVVSGIFSVGSCSVSLFFLLVLMIEELGYMWINWVFLVCLILIIPLLIIYRHKSKRAAADQLEKVEDEDVAASTNHYAILNEAE